MRVGVAGPLCLDEIIINGESREQTGGVTYYTGTALHHLGVNVSVFATFGEDNLTIPGINNVDVHKIPAEGTIKFINEYPDPKDPNHRVQRAHCPKNSITAQDIPIEYLESSPFLVLGPLYHDNFDTETIKEFSKHTRIVLIAQGLIRHLNGNQIVREKPKPVFDALPFVDYLALDEVELALITGTAYQDESISILEKHNPKLTTIVTKGSEGSRIYTQDNAVIIAAYTPRQVEDTTGAGDSYIAGFIKGLQMYQNNRSFLFHAGKFASMTATMSIESQGPFRGSTHEVVRRLQKEDEQTRFRR